MSRVLLTGGTGFVGSHAAERLARAGHDLRCTVRASSDLRWLEGLDAGLVEVDLAEASDLGRALDGVEAVVHVAGVTRARRDRVFREVNVGGTARLAEAARRAGVGRFVFVSSLAARGPDGGEGPASPYGRSKREAERRLREAAGGRSDAGRTDPRAAPAADPADGPDVVVLRPGGVYGPRDTDLLPLFQLADSGWFPAARGGGRVQPIFVEDVARAVVRAVAAGTPGFGPWPLAAGGRYRWPELGEAIGRALGRRVRIVPVPGAALLAAGAVAEFAAKALGRPPGFDRRSARDLARRSWTCDPSPSAEALGWRPRVELPDGLERTARWYREAGWL